MILNRGAIHRVRLSPTEGYERRSKTCLILQRQALSKVGTAIVIPLTTQKPRANYPLIVHLTAGTGGNPTECWAKITQLRVVAETRFQEQQLGLLSEEELEPIKSALLEVLDLF